MTTTPIQVTFNGATAEEVNERIKDYMSKIKGSRGPKGGDGDGAQTQQQTAPAPMQPPAMPGAPAMQGFNPGAFAPQAPAAAPGGAFPAAAAPAPGPAPEVLAIVQRIVARLDGALASGQPMDQAVAWFRNQIGPAAANYTLDQCKAALVNCAMPTLENIAKMMNA